MAGSPHEEIELALQELGEQGDKYLPRSYDEIIPRTIEAHLTDGTLVLPCTIAGAERLFDGIDLMRVYRSYLVNAEYVRCVDTDALVLSNGERIPVPVRRRRDVREWACGLALDPDED